MFKFKPSDGTTPPILNIKPSLVPVDVNILRYERGFLVILGADQVPVYNALQGLTPTATPYRGQNHIAFVNWPRFLSNLNELGYEAKVTDASNALSEATKPDWTISRLKRYFVVKKNPNRALVFPNASVIPGCTYDNEKQQIIVPLSEGWRLVELFKNLNIGYSDDSIRLDLLKSAELRLAIKSIHTQKEAPEIHDQITFKNPNFKLRDFQTIGVKFAEMVGFKTLIGDEMGLGKTPQAIAIHLHLKSKRTVLVVPATLRTNWSRHLFNLTGKHPFLCSGRTPTGYDVKELLISKPELVVINYDILRSKMEEQIAPGATKERYLWVELLNMYDPELIIADEIHYIKNAGSQQSKALRMLNAEHKIGLTGTPMTNRERELWPILNWLHPDTFPTQETFEHQYAGFSGAKKLQEMLETIMIRRRQQDVNPDYQHIEDIVQYHSLSEKDKERYKAAEQGIYEATSKWHAADTITKPQLIQNILVKIMRCKQICAEATVDATVELAELAAEREDVKHSKVLIFSQFKAIAYAIHSRLRESGSLQV